MATVVFVEPRSTFNAYGYFRFPIMGTLCLGTILKQSGHEVLVLRDGIRSIYDKETGWLHDALTQADVVAISVITCTANRAYEIADAVRKVAPSIRIIIGGSHPTYMAEEALEHADLVVKGEAEEVILDAVDNRKLTGIIQGTQVEDLNKIPFSDLSILSDQDRPPRVIPIYTSRGCPYDCTFCTVSSTFGRKYRFRYAGDVLEEIVMRVSNGHKWFFFYDDNFAANKQSTKILLEGILRRGLKIRWGAEARTDVINDKELLELMSHTNCVRMFIGLESVNSQTLLSYNKRQTVEDIKNCITQLHKYGIPVHGMFVLGSDNDNLKTVEDTVKFCHEMKLDSVGFSILHPLPGSRLYDILESENRIFTKDWSLFDGTHVVFYPKNINPQDLQEKYFWAWKKFYSLWKKPLLFPIFWYTAKKWKKINRQTLADFKRRFGPKAIDKAYHKKR